MPCVGEAIAGAALSAFFEALFEKLASSELLHFATEAKVHGEIKKWEKMLLKLHLVLDDAEEKKIENRLVEVWLQELKHLVYDVEDILDDFFTECMRCKIMGRQPRKFQKLISASFPSLSPWTFKYNSDMMSKIKEITTRFKDIVEEMKDLSLVENLRRTSSKGWQRPPSSCVQDEPTVYGRDGDKAKILELLFRYDIDDAKVGVIPIVGMSGMGKTTLAKVVYNDDSILDHDFQVKAWVCVSDIFDIVRVSKGILESITSQSSDLKELSEVQFQLKTKLAGKKFLIVLDDVWTNNYDNWHALRSPMIYGAPGSKIIVTTRSADVAKMMGTVGYYDLKRISDEDCWLLFKSHALENRSIVAPLELGKVGREIVHKRCGGLPLAARTLGGLLRSKESNTEWEEVLNNKLWSVFEGNSDILPVLELSYHYLPSHLKRCFAYCAILPKDYEFNKEDIILLWMAEGLIPRGDDKRPMEDLGGDYFHDLLSRSLFQVSEANQSRFVMHDLVNDMAQKVAEDACLRLGDEVIVCGDYIQVRVRHSSYIQGDFDGTNRFAPFCKMKCLRTFLPLSHGGNHIRYLANCVPYDLLQNQKYLRVLSFRHYNVKELPNSIGDLKHLRYLDFSFTKIKILPESTSSLCNLQTLILRECRELRRLPERMDKLINLRHLDITGTSSLEGIPLEIKELNGLQTLSRIVIGKGFFTITNLMSFKWLRGEFSISKLDNVVEPSDALKAKMKDKSGIDVLQLIWSNNNIDVEDAEVQYHVLDGLQPHRNLKKLTVSHYASTTFPSWMGDPMFNNIMQIRLEGCKKCTSLPQLGMLPLLKELFIKEMSSLQRVDQKFYGNIYCYPFPCLEVLCFEQLHNWEEWDVYEFEFRVLRELCIVDCVKLSGKLPIHLPSLEKLVINNCDNLVASLSSLPMLSVLEINGCKEVDFRCKHDFSFLTMVVLVGISSITNLAEGFLHGINKFKKLVVSDSQTKIYVPSNFSKPVGFKVISNLECVVGKSPQLMSMMVAEDYEQLQIELAGSELESLRLEDCGAHEKLPAWIQNLMFLRELTIEKWQSLVTFPKGGLPSLLKVLMIRNCATLVELTIYDCWHIEKLEIEDCDSLISLGRRQLPPTLKQLTIRGCKNLKSLLHEEYEGETSSASTNLEDLQMSNCESLTSISSGGELPATLKCLDIYGCSNLTAVLPGGKLPSRLQSFKISHCEKVESVAERFDYNTSLKSIFINACSSLQSLPEGLHNLINLRDFNISLCPIVSFPEGGLPTTTLRILNIQFLEKLEALPDNIHRLSSLQRFQIWNCPSLVYSISQVLPSNLTRLSITNLNVCKSLLEWGLHRLNSLQNLTVWEGCGEMRSFPSDETKMMLPPSLITLVIRDFPNLEYLSTRGFRSLTSLEYLYLGFCPKLTSFPENGLPHSLQDLDVFDCPKLKHRCEERRGPEWSKIVNIPKVRIRDGPCRVTFDQENHHI